MQSLQPILLDSRSEEMTTNLAGEPLKEPAATCFSLALAYSIIFPLLLFFLLVLLFFLRVRIDDAGRHFGRRGHQTFRLVFEAGADPGAIVEDVKIILPKAIAPFTDQTLANFHAAHIGRLWIATIFPGRHASICFKGWDCP